MNLITNPSDDDLDRLLAACGLKAPRPCGTAAAYKRHLRHKETPCEPCREANRVALRRWAASESTRARPINHGTAGGARSHQYRGEPACAACASAYNAYQRAQRAKRPTAPTA